MLNLKWVEANLWNLESDDLKSARLSRLIEWDELESNCG